MNKSSQGARQADQSTGNAPCRECGELRLHLTSCSLWEKDRPDRHASPVLDSERVASGEGLQKCVKCHHQGPLDLLGLCVTPVLVIGDLGFTAEIPCGHRCEFPSQPAGDGKLLPCPFCGGVAAWGEGEQKTKYGNEQAYCTNCYASTAPEMTKAEAAEWWNARTPAPVGAQPTQPRGRKAE